MVGLLGSSTGAWASPGAGAAAARLGNEPFRGGSAYSGNFPDPTVLRVGTTFYAHATTVGGLNLPATSSTDLRTWTARRPYDAERPFDNDAMPGRPAWALTKQTGKGRTFLPTWAPSVARLGPGRFVLAYSVPRASDGRRCISLARASHPLGPFVDRSTRPLTCLGGRGAIDPQVFRDRGAVWLLYKVEGSPDRLMARRMTASASGFGPRSRNYPLLAPRTKWEGSIVENPAMIRSGGRLYLFYSANGFASARYATGYAECRAVTGPCVRRGRLLATGPHLAGPGGATPFLDRSGRLRLAYHAWRTGNVGTTEDPGCVDTAAGCPQRRLYVATLGQGRAGALVLRRRY